MPPRALLHVVRGALVGFSPYERSAAFAKLGMNRSGNASRPRNQVAIAVSYAAVVAKPRPPVAAGVRGEPPRRAQLLEDLGVALRRADRRDVGEVLRGRAEHRRPADVDHLDRVRLGDAVARGDLREGVEADADEVDRLDPVVVERRRGRRGGRGAPGSPRGSAGGASSRGRRASPGSRSAPPPASRGSRSPRDARRCRRRRGRRRAPGVPARTRPARTCPRPTGGRGGSLDQAADGLGRRRCSTAWTRARSVSTVSPSCTGTGSATITAPVSMPSST